MDMKIKIKEELPFSEDISQTENESFSQDFEVKLHSDAAVWDKFCDMEIKTEIKEEAIVSDFCSENKKQVFIEDAVTKLNECNKECEMNMKIEIKEELWCLEKSFTEYPCVADVTKDVVNETFPSTESIRLYGEESSVLCYDKNNTRLNMTKNRPECEAAKKYRSKDIDTSKMFSLEENVNTEHDGGEMSRKSSCMKRNNFFPQNDAQKQNLNNKNDCFESALVEDNVGLDYKCDICELRFSSSSDLKMHKFIHGGKRPKISDKNFAQLSQLKKDKMINLGIKPLKCDSCAKCFVQLSQLKRHKLTHEGVRPHKCDTCGRCFGYLSQLRKHELNHTVTKPYKCDTCGKCFARLSELKRHEDIRPQKCDICGKRFVHLKSHKFTHEGIRPHSCDTCGKRFVFVSHLKQHKLIHEGIKPHKCDICGKCFVQLSQLKQHKLIHEGTKATKM